jgi:murein DD-endopeptidase MepM/ murein hydrolase activator NlpD
VTAQFYTLKPETRKISKMLLYKGDSISQRTLPKEVSEEELVSMGKGYKVTISRDVPVFVNLTDSLLSGLIKERMNVCLPLDLLNVNSAFGIRRDPISLCRKFHDGIDFQCRYGRVYSMLPGIEGRYIMEKRDMAILFFLIMVTCNVCTDIYPI